jgi:hypothetical protein
MPEQSTFEQLDFVELNRRFRKLDEDTKSEDAALGSYTAGIWRKNTDFGWDDLLKEFRVVILGEPGSGKTWELRERVKMLVVRNEFAFFINLDGLVQRDLLALFGDKERARFDRWRQSTAPAYFFLDSVDEAKFRSLSDFYSAPDRLPRAASALRPCLGLLSLGLSGRQLAGELCRTSCCKICNNSNRVPTIRKFRRVAISGTVKFSHQGFLDNCRQKNRRLKTDSLHTESNSPEV